MVDRNTAGNRMVQVKDGVVGPIEPDKPSFKEKTVADYPSTPKAYLEVAENYGPALSGPPLCDELLELIQHMFTEEEADVIQHLKPGESKTAQEIAERAHRPVEEVRPILDVLAREKYIIVSRGRPPGTMYRIIPIVPGAFETILVRTSLDSVTDWHRGFAKFYQKYFDAGLTTVNVGRRAAGIRYLPVGQTIENHQQALPFDYFKEIVDQYNDFAVGLCQCRLAEHLVGRDCGRPMEVCASIGVTAVGVVKQGRGRAVSKEELLDIKAEAEASGLVTWAMLATGGESTTSCSCCGCCCGMMRSISQFNMPGRIAPPHFMPKFDADKCSYCGKCALACPMGAITIDTKAKTRTFESIRCVGCGLCVVKCKEKDNALELEAVPDYELPELKPREMRGRALGF